MVVQPGLCQTWSGTQIVGFLTHRLKYSFRRRQSKKARKKGNLQKWAPGKDDLDRPQNQYDPEPTSHSSQQLEGPYANVTKQGTPNEATDPALDPMGYLKSLTKQQREEGNELYYEAKSEKDMHKKEKKKKRHKKKVKKEEENKEKFTENDEQPVYENKDVHVNEAFEQPSYLDLTNSVDKSTTPSVTPKTSKSTLGKNGDPIKKDKVSVNKNEKDKTKTDKAVKTKAKTDKEPVNNDEIDEEYEIPDTTNYPEPKKSPAIRTYVNSSQNQQKNKKSSDKDRNKAKEVTGKSDKSNSGAQRQSKYENVKETGKYVNVPNSETVEPVTDEYYEVPENQGKTL